jgi:hypothetical protein
MSSRRRYEVVVAGRVGDSVAASFVAIRSQLDDDA